MTISPSIILRLWQITQNTDYNSFPIHKTHWIAFISEFLQWLTKRQSSSYFYSFLYDPFWLNLENVTIQWERADPFFFSLYEHNGRIREAPRIARNTL